MRLLKVFENQLAAPGTVKSENDDSEWAEHAAKPARHARLHMAAVDDVATQRREHCTIGRDERRIRSQAKVREQRRGVGRAAAGGDGHRDSRLLRGPQRPRIALADGLRKRRQKSAIHVDCDEARGRVHRFSVSRTGTEKPRDQGNEGPREQESED